MNFDLTKVIEHFNLDADDVANALFPHQKHKKLALNRVLKGEAYLDTVQLQSLSNLIGISMCDLFTVDNWKGISENGNLVFKKGEYKALLNYKGVALHIYKKEELIYEKLLLSDMTIQEFINYINTIINNKENGKFTDF